MKRKFFIILLSLSFILLVIILAWLQNNPPKNQKIVCFKRNCFEIELAATPEERKTGLMYREKLEANKGMLFIFEDEEIHSFWMKNTLIPLDIIWINENKEIVFIIKNAQPCQEQFCLSLQPAEKAKYVLEINGGLAEKMDLAVGDRARIEY